MATKEGVWEYAAAKLPAEIKDKVRVIAAMQKRSVAVVGGELLAMGLDEYLKGGNLDSTAIEAMETAASFKAVKEGVPA